MKTAAYTRMMLAYELNKFLSNNGYGGIMVLNNTLFQRIVLYHLNGVGEVHTSDLHEHFMSEIPSATKKVLNNGLSCLVRVGLIHRDKPRGRYIWVDPVILSKIKAIIDPTLGDIT